METQVKCPACTYGNIYIDVNQLIQGCRFECPNCGSVLSLSQGSKETLSNGLAAYEKIKSKRFLNNGGV